LRGIGSKFLRRTARANISGVASGMSEKSMSSSFIASIRFQSVSDFFVVDLFFILGSLSERYYPRNFICLSVGNSHDCSVEHAQREKANLAVIAPIVQKRKRVVKENSFDCEKVKSVLRKSRSALGFVPLKTHSSVVTNCSYVNLVRLLGDVSHRVVKDSVIDP